VATVETLKAYVDGKIRVNGTIYEDHIEREVRMVDRRKTSGKVLLPKDWIDRTVHVYLTKKWKK